MMKSTNENLFGEQLCLGGKPVVGFALGFGKPGDWYYTRMVTADDVREAKNRVDTKFQSVARDVKACVGLTDEERAAWNDLVTSWRKLYCLNDSGSCSDPNVSNTLAQIIVGPFAGKYAGSGGEMDDVERYEKLVYEWQQKLNAKKCALSAPIDKPDVIRREESEKTSDILDTVKVVAIAVVVTAGVVYIVPQIAKLVPSRKEK